MKNINARGYQLFPFCLFPSPLPSQWGPVPKMYEKTIDNKGLPRIRDQVLFVHLGWDPGRVFP